MIKKVFKFIFKFLIAIILLTIISYFSFLGWEYISGHKFVDYLEKNSETVKIDDSFSFELMKTDLEENKLILVGEMHGYDEPTKFDLDFFIHLHKNYGVKNYVAELDYVQANELNIFLETGDSLLLHDVLKKWAVLQGRDNKDYYDKFYAFHQYYKRLADDNKFRFIGIDKVQDWGLFTDYINELSALETSFAPIIYNKENLLKNLKNRLIKFEVKDSLLNVSKFDLAHLLQNIEYTEGKIGREKVLYQNFHNIYKGYDLSKEKVYGYFGVTHVFQYQINEHETLASLIRKSDLGLENNILSMNFLFVDSEMVIKSKMLPEFMRTSKINSKIDISADDIKFLYIYGIQDFKRITGEYEKSLIKMNGMNNPYANSNRLTTILRLFPVIPVYDMNEKGKPYIQYTIFVRNSEWAEPYKK